MKEMTDTIALLAHAVDAEKDNVLAAERYIWRHPETGYREWNTHKYLKEHFERLGYTVTEAGNIPGFITELDTGRPGPTLGIFAEMDSLIVPTHPECDPKTGAVHACGHHAQSAAMVGIAAALKAPGALDGLCGKIRLLVVPAEELIELEYRTGLREAGTIRYYGGKQEFLYRGLLDGVDLSFMLHTGGGKGIGSSRGSNGCVVKYAEFRGKAVHASAPAYGVNALYAATSAINAANAVRETFKEADTIRFHPIITAGGAAVNSIPDRVTVESYVRGGTMQAIAAANKKVNRAFVGSAYALGCGLLLRDHHGYAPRINDCTIRDAFHDAASMFYEDKDLRFTDSFDLGCSDMGDISCVMPSAHPHSVTSPTVSPSQVI